MKHIRLLLTLTAGSLLVQSVHAVLFRSSQIVGYSTGNLGADATTGSLEGWQNSTAQVTVTNGSGSLIGTNLGLVASEGDRVFISATTALNARNQFVAGGTFPTGTLAVDTNIYYSFLYRFRNAADVSTDGELIIRVNRANSGTGTAQHWDLLARNVGGQIQLGIAKAGAPNNATNYATTNISAGQTIFVVVRQHILPEVQNDVYDLWINPPAESFGTNEVDVPPSSVSVGGLTTDGAEDTSNTGPGRFVVVAGANAEFDEFRVANTWAEVTPYFGQCVSASVPVGPTNVTQSAEIAATFNVIALGTSPTIQWQVSTNGGVSFSDIAGATASSYTTPNLALTESGNQYRAIATVGCNGSSATSTVATVTLTAPVPSAVGIVMCDTFLDPDLGFDDRSNPPLSSSNSIWYTAVTDNLTAFEQGGNMVGTPLSGSSSLWLGYFIETNQLPVHLGIGRAIKVTLPFTPNSFNSFTNNAGLRFGLFDYFDGGTRLTGDGPNAGGSRGNGVGVRGYMLNLNFGTNFMDATPLEILARNFLPDVNLMGTVSDYASLGSGPIDEVDTNAPAFQAGTPYTLEFQVTRAAVNSVEVRTTISGGPTTWSHTVTDNNYAYHRFDAFGLRPNSLETSADKFTFPEFKVEVIAVPIITEVLALAPNSVKLTWESVSGVTYHVLSRGSITGAEMTNATVMATGSSTSYTNTPTLGAERYYRVLALP